MSYADLANWVGWPPVVGFLLIIGSIGIWLYESRLKLKNEKIEFLEGKLKDSENQAPEILIKKLVEMRENLKKELDHMNGPSEHDGKKIKELQEKLDRVNSELASQQEIINQAQYLLEDTVLPRGGKYREEIASDIQNTIGNQKCIYLPVEIENMSEEVLAEIKKNQPYKLDVIFPGMNKMLMLVTDKMDDRVGFLSNPYIGLYFKDYYVTLLRFLHEIPYEHIGRDSTSEGDVMLFPQSIFHAISPINPSIIYIKIPIN